MRRSITLISVVVTTFSAGLLASVIYGVRVGAGQQSTPATSRAVANLRPFEEPVATPTAQSPMVSPQQAATIAQGTLGRTDAYSVELADYNGVQAFKVTFSSGDVVYVSLAGQVLGAVPPEVQVVSQRNPREKEHAGGGGGGGGGGDSGGESESGGDD
jgi:hypothetical protein